MSDSLHFAFEYHDRGWPVVPVVGKAPAIAWAAYQEKRPTLDQVRDWFAGHDYNLAVVTGSVSELVVIDCDTSEDASWWEQRFPATPLVVFTGGGGKHFYYRYPASRVSNRTRMFGRRIDIRAEGGLVVAPPSVHPCTGRGYRWKPWDYYAFDEVPVFDVRWLRESSPRLAPRLDSPPSTRRTESPIQNGVAYIGHIEAVSGSGGHNATFRAACKLRDSGLSAQERSKR